MATRSQGVRLSDKFRANIRIALPAAVVCFAIYCVNGAGSHTVGSIPDFSLLKVLPYLAVLVVAMVGVDVMLVLLLGNVLTGVIGLSTGAFDAAGWFNAMAKGVAGMSETILIALLAGGLMEVIRHNGGIDFIISRLTRHIRGKRGAEGAISALVALTNCVTANNTVAILSVGRISNDIATRYGVNKCKSASLLDTFSCVAQGLLPYGAVAPRFKPGRAQSPANHSEFLLQFPPRRGGRRRHLAALSAQIQLMPAACRPASAQTGVSHRHLPPTVSEGRANRGRMMGNAYFLCTMFTEAMGSLLAESPTERRPERGVPSVNGGFHLAHGGQRPKTSNLSGASSPRTKRISCAAGSAPHPSGKKGETVID